MGVPRILWLEDQQADLNAFKSGLFRAGYWIDCVSSISETIKNLREDRKSGDPYSAIIFDIKVLPGSDPLWQNLDIKLRNQNPNFDPNLGLEMMRSLFNPFIAKVMIDPPLPIDPKKIIVFSIIADNDIVNEIVGFGIPKDQVLSKSDSHLNTLPEVIDRIMTVSKMRTT